MGWRRQVEGLLARCVRTFPEPVVFRPLGSDRVEIEGIYRAANRVLDEATGVPINAPEPVLDIRLADVRGPAPEEGDEVDVRGVRYRVQSSEPDGEGMTTLRLSEK